ncbi:MAG: prepilin-type processing-associated H-X9-DG protein [Methylophagaceae bacterium]|jgi:prepilin-type processing-associated H-X9-DG protein
MKNITMVRIYLSESRDHYERLVNWLYADGRVQGVSVFRAIEGFGKDRKMKTSSLINLSLELPVVIEFFDTPEIIIGVLEQVQEMVKVDHIVTWSAQSGI